MERRLSFVVIVTMNSNKFSGIPENNNQSSNRVYGPYRNKKDITPKNTQRGTGRPHNIRPGRYDFSQYSVNKPGLFQTMGRSKFIKYPDQNSSPENSGRNNLRPNRPYFSDPLILVRVSQVGSHEVILS